jgi:hypothetical protein
MPTQTGIYNWTYQNPYGSTTFPTSTSNTSPILYGNTTFPTTNNGISPNEYGNTIFPGSINVPVQSLYEDTITITTPPDKFNRDEIDPATNNQPGSTYVNRFDIVQNTGNVVPGSIFGKVGLRAAAGGFSGIGNPILSQLSPLIPTLFKKGNNDQRGDNLDQPYAIMPFERKKQLINWNLTKYKDFRSFKGNIFNIDNIRLDGASAASRGAFNSDAGGTTVSSLYAAASVIPGGAYTAFNLESIYGWGNQGSPEALRRDFTIRSNVATRWKSGTKPADGKWVPTNNPIERGTEFLGDKISVIDFSKRKLKDAYIWKPQWFAGTEKWKGFNDFISSTDLTRDFIKFYFTGPKLNAGNKDDADDIIVFRAIIDSFSDTHSPSWTAVPMIGRADPNYTYTGYSREVNLSFTIYATSRDEMKPIYRKLNALAGYTTPDYSADTIAMKSPWMRMTIGDLLVQQPVIINSLAYTFIDADTTWEINVEQDPTMMQAPHKISVSLGLNVLTDWLPEKGGKFYSLAKSFSSNGTPQEGGDNWLSDTPGTDQNIKIKRERGRKENPTSTSTTNVKDNTESTELSRREIRQIARNLPNGSLI